MHTTLDEFKVATSSVAQATFDYMRHGQGGGYFELAKTGHFQLAIDSLHVL